ncbi:hypothetical protein RJ640_009620 [Escallonia rubra]|uniref:P-loop containing nucleoside triphosphate hydrolases superfamily protein n=1 Tax=Escallonia rubra TaxID=112253 RepID=A0AA88QZC8_9ASTE|nr:hypothetical protein RJ640_009620 [Escallonia rubra]
MANVEVEEGAREGSSNSNKSLIDIVFSWSIEDVLNNDLYKDKVEQIPKTFASPLCYMKSFVFPLIEETRADLCSSMGKLSSTPTCEIFSLDESEDFDPPGHLHYDIIVERKSNITDEAGAYEPETGDLISVTDVRPKCIDDLNRPRRSFITALVQKVRNEKDFIKLIVLSNEFQTRRNELRNFHESVVPLINMTTNMRIWQAMNSKPEGMNSGIFMKVLQPDQVKDRCSLCLKKGDHRATLSHLDHVIRPFKLNNSQAEAVSNCIATKNCCHESMVKLIWGPPGTGKTKTVAVLLYALLGLRCRTVTCAPTNIAVKEVTARLLRSVTESLAYDIYGLGDIVLFGNRKRMKIDEHSEFLNIFLDYRAKILAKCFAPAYGWRHCLETMIGLLEDPEKQYRLYLRNEKYEKEKHEEGDDSGDEESCCPNLKGEKTKIIWRKVIAQTLKRNIKRIQWNSEVPTQKDKHSKYKKSVNLEDQRRLSFEEFVRQRFMSERDLMKFCVVNLLIHLPTSCIVLAEVKNMIKALELLDQFGSLFSNTGAGVNGVTMLNLAGRKCLQILRSLREAFTIPDFHDEYSIKVFCLQKACLFFCTASSSAKLHDTSAELLIIDEAAQLKECESAIPLQIPGLLHAILIGDEKQLPALVKSKISEEAGFGRSLFERLILMGCKKHLLNLQYRMHPSISLFPNREFYHKKISDSQIVKQKSYQRRFLQGDIYSSYSFINVAYGNEELCDGNSLRNMVEVSVVVEVVATLFKESTASKQKVYFYDNFWKSMAKITSIEIRKEAISLLTKLSSGWRRPCNEVSRIIMDGMYSQLAEIYKVNGPLHIVWTVDILEENSQQSQVLKVWDILPLSEIPNLGKELDNLSGNQVMDIMQKCKLKCMDGYASYLQSTLVLFVILRS